MKPALLDSHDRPSREDIQAFERELGYALPDDYKAFLRTTNGGTFHDEVCTPDFVSVEELYGLNAGFDWADLATAREQTRGWIPDTALPVASSAESDQICLSLESESLGAVYRYCQDSALGDFLDAVSLHDTSTPIAASFTEMLDGLIIHPDAEQGGDPNEHAAFQAIDSGRIAVLAKLIDDGIDPNLRNNLGESLVARAAYKCRIEALTMLLSRGGDPNIQDDNGANAAFYAVYAMCVDCLKVLIAKDVDINARNRRGNSLLIEAIRRGAVRCALRLIEVGADVHYRSPSGATALSCCSLDTTERYVLPALKQVGAPS